MSKLASRSKKITSTNRTSELIDGTLRHFGTKQKLFYEAHVCTIYRVTLAAGESFTESRALQLLDKYHRKRQAHCTMSFLEDRVSLERSKSLGRAPFRSWVSYKEIRHFFLSHSKPEFFVLCVDSYFSNQGYYEIYKCKTPESLRKVEEMITRATNNPDKILCDLTELRQVSINDQERARSLVNFEVDENRETVLLDSEEEDDYNNHMSDIKKQSPSPGILKDPSPSFVQQTKTFSALQSSATKVGFVNSNGLDGMTYLEYDPVKGARENETGPIFMFAQRNENEFGRNNYHE